MAMLESDIYLSYNSEQKLSRNFQTIGGVMTK